MTSPRQRLRARGLHVIEPGESTALATRADTSIRARTAPFHIELNGEGTITLLEYDTPADEHARIDFDCLVAGVLRITVNRESVLEAKTYGGSAFVAGLFFPEGARVVVNFTNLWAGGLVAGKVSISPSPEEDAADAARDLFGLRPQYTPEELTKAYKKLVTQWHPDRPGGNAEKLREVNFFYKVLRDRLG